MSLVVGCGKIAESRSFMIDRPTKNKYLHNVRFAGISKSANVQVFFQEGLNDQADCLAYLTDQFLVYVEDLTGIQTSADSYTIYMVLDSSEHLESSQITWEPNDGFGVILFAKKVSDSCESVIAQSYVFPSVFVHEAIEHASVYCGRNVDVENDYKDGGLSAFGHKHLYYTRWFREGISTYCAMLAYESMMENINFKKNGISHSILFNGFSLHPFSALAKIKTNIFIWHQFSKFSPPPLSPNMPYEYETTSDYYDAALGLFLLVRDQFGEDIIHEIICEIGTSESVDGAAIMKIFDSVLGLNFEQFIRNFHFPQTGLYMDPSLTTPNAANTSSGGLNVSFVEPNSIADKAEIKKGDLIYKINTIDIESNLDFEFALYKLMSDDSVTVYLRREGTGEVTTELKLSESSIKND